MGGDCVAETRRCLLKFDFAAVSGSPDYSCHHDVLKKATPRMNTLLRWYVEGTGDVGGTCPGSQQRCVEEAGGWLPGAVLDRAGGSSEGLGSCWPGMGDLAACMGRSQNCVPWRLKPVSFLYKDFW